MLSICWMAGWVNNEYALKLCFCLFNKKTCAMLLSIFLHIKHGSPCIWALQNLNVKAWVPIVNL